MKSFLIVLIALFITALPSNVHARYLGTAPFYISKYAQDVKTIKDIYVVNGNIELWGTPINNYNDFDVNLTQYYNQDDKNKILNDLNINNYLEEGAKFLEGKIIEYGYYNVHLISARDIENVPQNSFVLHLRTNLSFFNLDNSQIIVSTIQSNLSYIPEGCDGGYLKCLTTIVETNPYVVKLGIVENFRQENQEIRILTDEPTKTDLKLTIKSSFGNILRVLKNFHWANHLRKKHD